MAAPRDGPTAGIVADVDRVLDQVDARRELAGGQDATPERARVYDFSIRWGVLLPAGWNACGTTSDVAS